MIDDDYARAERFLCANKDRYVINADIQSHWVGAEDRFWYLRSTPAGDKEFVIVDAASGKQAPAFDQERLAGALSKATGTDITPGRLPFSSFHYTQDGSAIQFQLGEQLWTYRPKTATCEVMALEAAAHEVLSPDGRWAAFSKDHNVWIRPTAGGREFPATTDGIEHHAYACPPECSTRSVSDRRQGKPIAPRALWSPDSSFLLTHRVDERLVEELFLIQSVPEDGSLRPRLHTYRYAMPGDAHLPLIELVTVQVAERRKVTLAAEPMVSFPQTLLDKRDAWWSADGAQVYFLSRDRYAKRVSLCSGDPTTGVVREILREESNTLVHTNAENVFDVPQVRTLANGDLIWYSQRDGWGHFYYYDRRGVLRNRITQGAWAARDIVHVDESDARLYFMASGREAGRDIYEQYLYSTRFDGSDLRLLTPEAADHKWPLSISRVAPHDMRADVEKRQFSPSGRYFLDSYSRPDLPPVFILRTADGGLIKQLEQADISKLHRSITPATCSDPAHSALNLRWVLLIFTSTIPAMSAMRHSNAQWIRRASSIRG